MLFRSLGQVGRQVPTRDGDAGEILRQAFEEVVLAVQEGQPAWLVLLDDGHLDAVQHGQAPALEPGQQGLALGIARDRFQPQVVALLLREWLLQTPRPDLPPAWFDGLSVAADALAALLDG